MIKYFVQGFLGFVGILIAFYIFLNLFAEPDFNDPVFEYTN
jgi:hypothetical protein